MPARGPFEVSPPATRRMGHTMLGVAPKPGGPDATPSSPTHGVVTGAESGPLAPVPETLTGSNPRQSPTGISLSQSDSSPQTKADIGDPSKTLPVAQSRTLMGFAAPPKLKAAEPSTAHGLIADARPDALAASLPPNGEQLPAQSLDPNATLVAAVPNNRGGPSDPHEVATPKAPPARSMDPKATLVGVMPLGQSSPATRESNELPPRGTAADPNATLVGVSPLNRAQAPAPPALAAPKELLKGTLLGVSPFVAPSRESTDQDVAVAAPSPKHLGPATLPVAPTSPHATMLGVAPPLAQQKAAGDPNGWNQPPEQAATGVPQTADHKGTLLGVAMPGIAPLQPGHAKGIPTPQVPAVSAAPRARRQVTADPGTATTPGEAARVSQRRRLAWIFGSAASLLLVLVIVALGFWWTSVHLAVDVTSGETGNERLVLTCSNCPDGTTATIEKTTATFNGRKTTIDLTRRLSIGKNELTLLVARPNRPRGEAVSVTVPVEFRVTSSIADLAANPPTISALLESTPGTTFVVEGRSMVVGQDGQARIPIDVSEMLIGQASAVVQFERRIAYEVLRPEATKKGTLIVRSGITPLEIATPGMAHVTPNATFTLSGRTAPQAKLTANGHVIAVSADGTFRQEMALSSPGSTKLYVRAQEAQQAPRLVEIALERVTNLRQRADELSRTLPSNFDTIFGLAEKVPDSLVALHAELVAIEPVGASTRLVGTSNCVRGPCLASIRFGGPLTMRRGDRFIALGKARLAPRANSSEQDLTIEASLVVEDARR